MGFDDITVKGELPEELVEEVKEGEGVVNIGAKGRGDVRAGPIFLGDVGGGFEDKGGEEEGGGVGKGDTERGEGTEGVDVDTADVKVGVKLASGDIQADGV